MSNVQTASLHLRPATAADLPGLADVFYLSFHPVSAYMRRAIPDTPLVREYWNTANTCGLNDPDVRLNVIVDKSVNPENVIALCRLRAPSSSSDTSSTTLPDEKPLDAGIWSRISLTADHDAQLCNGFIDFLALGRNTAMKGVKHYAIELLATSHEYKGCGAGRLLIDWVCAEADKAKCPIFVLTNGAIVKFYERFSFDVVERLIMPGDYGYEEFIMVRPVKSSAAQRK